MVVGLLIIIFKTNHQQRALYDIEIPKPPKFRIYSTRNGTRT